MTIDALHSFLKSWATAKPFPVTVAVLGVPPPMLSLPPNRAAAAESRGVCVTILASKTDGAPRLGFWLPESGRSGSCLSTLNGEDELIICRLPDFASPAEALALIDPLTKEFLSDCAAQA